MRYAMCMLHRLALHVASARVASEQYVALYVASTCRIDACCIGAPARLVAPLRVARCMLRLHALQVASARIACCFCARCKLHRCALHRLRCISARCIGASHRLGLPRPLLHRLGLPRPLLHRLVLPRPLLHRRRAAVPQRRCRVMRCSVCCVCAARSGEGRAVAVAERRRDALVRRAWAAAACSPWTRAPRCSTPWRYPAPQQGCVRG